MKENKQSGEESVDKKRVAITIGVIFILLAGFITLRQIYSPTPKKEMPKSVKGLQTSINQVDMPSFPIPSMDLQKKVDNIKSQISHIDVAEVASSSPQVQDIIKQIQNLPQLPSAVARDVCESLCKKL